VGRAGPHLILCDTRPLARTSPLGVICVSGVSAMLLAALWRPTKTTTQFVLSTTSNYHASPCKG
jgi:hypothetical protein